MNKHAGVTRVVTSDALVGYDNLIDGDMWRLEKGLKFIMRSDAPDKYGYVHIITEDFREFLAFHHHVMVSSKVVEEGL